jgi:hypothetical protein
MNPLCLHYFRAKDRLSSRLAYAFRSNVEADTLKDVFVDASNFWPKVDLIMCGLQPTPKTIVMYKQAVKEAVSSLEHGKDLTYLDRRLKAKNLMQLQSIGARYQPAVCYLYFNCYQLIVSILPLLCSWGSRPLTFASMSNPRYETCLCMHQRMLFSLNTT